MSNRGSFAVGPQGPPGLSTGPAGGDLGGTYPDPTLVDTANVDSIVRTSRLDQMAAPTASVNLNNQKLTNIANGTVSGDAAAFGQIPTSLPPSGAASGDLAGTYPAPTLTGTTNVNNVVRANRLDQMAAPQANISMNNQKIINISAGTAIGNAATFEQIPLTLPPSGPAGNDLAGTYPNPTVAKINGTAVSTGPTTGAALVATSTSASNWQITPGLYPGTGVIGGGVISQVNATQFAISAGKGIIVDFSTDFNNPVATPVTINAQTVTLNASQLLNPINWVLIDNTGGVVIQATRPQHAQRRNQLQLGAVGCATGVITSVTPGIIYLPQMVDQFHDFLYEIGPFNVGTTSNVISPVGANLQIQKTAGQVFSPTAGYVNGPNEIHFVTTPAENPAAFSYSTRLAGSLTAPVSLIDPTRYDAAGIVSLIGGGSNNTTIQRVFLLPSGSAGNQLVVQYGQTIYANISDAQAALGAGSFIQNPDIEGAAILLCWIIMTRVCTNLQDTANCKIIRANPLVYP